MSQGDLYAILAGLVWSFCVILMRISGYKIRPVALTLFKSFVAVLFFALLLPILREPYFQDLSARDYGRLAISAVLGITIADTMYAAALNRLGASLQALASCTYSPSMAAIGFVLYLVLKLINPDAARRVREKVSGVKKEEPETESEAE